MMDQNEPTPLEPGSPEYEAGLVEQFDNAQGSNVEKTPEVPQRPDDVPEKFWDAKTGKVNYDALLASYKELEKAKSQPTEKSAEEAPKDQKAAEEALNDRGLDFQKYADSFAKNGALTDADYSELEKAGIDRSMVDAFIEGQMAVMEGLRGEMYGLVGGQESYQTMAQWASTNLSGEELDAYNEAVESGNRGLARIAVQGLYARYTAENGSDPKLVGGSQNASPGDVYRSTQQLVRDMQDPRYESDPAFRADVEAKLARSSIF